MANPLQERKKPASTILEKHINACRSVLWQTLSLSLVSNLMMLALPIYSLQVLDRVISSGSTDTLLMLTLVTTSALICLSLVQSARSFILVRMGEWLDKKLSPAMFAHSIESSVLQAGLSTGSGSQHLRDLGVIKNFLSGPTLAALLDAPWSIIFIIILFMIHPINGLIAILGGIILFIMAYLNEKMTKSLLDESGEHVVKAMSQAEVITRNSEAVESMGMLKNIVKKWEVTSAKGMALQSLASDRSAIISGASRFIRLLLQVAITGVGGYLVLENKITVGGIIAGSIIVGRALAPFENSIASWKGFISARKSYSRLRDSLIKFPAREETMKLPKPAGNLVVENVYFKPPGSDKPTIRGINFELKPGELLGIVGPSAAGKSTMAKMITGVWKPAAGIVRLDGADVYIWNREDFGKHVGYLPQDVELFPGTIKENIARMDDNADPENVVKAAKTATAHEMILSLPKGYDTDIGISGAALSAGQRQRVGLARAFYGDVKLVVLDEPNANLDGEGEAALVSTLKHAKANKITTIIISHRPSLMAEVDKMLVVREGVAVAFGDREEVMQKLAAGSGQRQ